MCRTCSASETRVQRGDGGGGGLQELGQRASIAERFSHPAASLLLDAHGSGGGTAHPSHSHLPQPDPHIPSDRPHAQLHSGVFFGANRAEVDEAAL